MGIKEENKEFWEKLDAPCWRCSGVGGQNYYRECATCGGSGYLLTDAGSELLKFLGRHKNELENLLKSKYEK